MTSVLVGNVLLTNIPMCANVFPLIKLGCRQLLVKSSHGAYGKEPHCGVTLQRLRGAKNQTHASSQEVADSSHCLTKQTQPHCVVICDGIISCASWTDYDTHTWVQTSKRCPATPTKDPRLSPGSHFGLFMITFPLERNADFMRMSTTHKLTTDTRQQRVFSKH